MIGEADPLNLIWRVALLAPVADGLNRTPIWQVPPDGTVSPVQVSLLTRKSPLSVPITESLETISG